mmetsp:Transcript_75587/g.235320  ORF Transcript_75587/g.235320 Transcript_75587/m.235320 type:complete len:600 (-) Transcript_75587:124-1923(-)
MARWCWAALLVAVASHAQEDEAESMDHVFLLQTRRTLEGLTSGECQGMIDLVFLIDESGSTCGPDLESTTYWQNQYGGLTCEALCRMPPPDWEEPDGKINYRGQRMYKYQAERQFVKDMIGQFTLGPEDTMVAIVGFSNDQMASSTRNGARVISGWSSDAGALEAGLDTTTGVGATYPNRAMGLAEDLLGQGRPSAAKFAVILMDGTPSGGPWQSAADSLKSAATVIAIGYAGGASPPTLSAMATDSEHMFSNFDLSATADHLATSNTLGELVVPEATCEIFDDPHVYGFDDARRGPVALLKSGVTRGQRGYSFHRHPMDVNAYGEGDFWLMRSKLMHVQGRLRRSEAFVPDRAAVGAVAIGGPLLHDSVLLVAPMEDGRVLWRGQPVQLGNFSLSYPGGTLALLHQKRGSEKPRNRLEANFSSGLRVTIDRFPRYLNVMLATRPLSGGIDGECGNFNRNHQDDSEQEVAKRMGSLEVPEWQRLGAGTPLLTWSARHSSEQAAGADAFRPSHGRTSRGCSRAVSSRWTGPHTAAGCARSGAPFKLRAQWGTSPRFVLAREPSQDCGCGMRNATDLNWCKGVVDVRSASTGNVRVAQPGE